MTANCNLSQMSFMVGDRIDGRIGGKIQKKTKNLCSNREKEDMCTGQFRENISFLLDISIDG